MHALPSALLPLLMTASAAAQPPDTFLRDYAQTQRYLGGRPTQVRIAPDGATVYFLRSPARSRVQTLFAFDVATGKTEEVLTPEAVLQGAAQTLSPQEAARLERQRVSARGFTSYDFSADGSALVLPLSGRLYLVDRKTKTSRALPTGEGAPIDPKLSADGKHLAYVRGGDVWVLELASGKEKRLTHCEGPAQSCGEAEFVAQEEMDRFSGYFWSPDGQSIAYQKTDLGGVEQLAIVDPMHPEKGAQTFSYPRAGTPNAKVTLWIAKLAGGKPVQVSWDHEAFPYLATVKWPKKGPLTLVVQNRTQTKELVLSVEPSTGATHTLLTEEDPAWVNLIQAFPRWLDDGSGFFWFTERNGGSEVELRDASGRLVQTWVPKDAGFDEYVGYDEAAKELYFTGSPDPTESVLYKVRAGHAPVRLAFGAKDAAMQVAQLSPKGGVITLSATTLSSMPRVQVFRTDGTLAGELPSVAEEPPFRPTTQVEKVGPGEGLYAAVIRPRDFVAARKYPVVVQVYGGPHHTEVRHSMREELLNQWVADRGFVVVKVDNRGTTRRRGRDFERAVKFDLGGVTIDDQVTGLRALAQKHPELDLSRVGIMGWSFGGYMAALGPLRHPEVFKVGIAGAPVTDWRDYDTHYTERYMGLPKERAADYDRASALTYAPKLDGRLLLIHGTADDNVYFFHTLKLSDALFRAGKPHLVLPLSDFTHMVADPLVTERLWERIAGELESTLKPRP